MSNKEIATGITSFLINLSGLILGLYWFGPKFFIPAILFAIKVKVSE